MHGETVKSGVYTPFEPYMYWWILNL